MIAGELKTQILPRKSPDAFRTVGARSRGPRKRARFALLALYCIALLCAGGATAASGAERSKARRRPQRVPAKTVQQQYYEYLNEGNKLYHKRRFNEARREYRRAMALLPKRLDAYQRTYETYVREKNWTQAQKVALQALETVPNSQTRYMVYECAQRHLRNKDSRKALPAFEKLNKQWPRDLSILDSLLSCYNDRNQHSEAVRAGEVGLEAYLEYYEENPDKRAYRRPFVTCLAKAYAAQGKLDDAILRAELMLLATTAKEAGKTVLATLLREKVQGPERTTNPMALVPAVERLAQVTGVNRVSFHEIISAIEKKEGVDTAIKVLQRWVAGLAENDSLRYTLADRLYRAKRYEESEQHYRNLLSSEGYARSAMLRLPQCLIIQDKLDEAYDVLEEQRRLAEASPRSPKEKRSAINTIVYNHLQISRQLRRKETQNPTPGVTPTSPKATAYLEKCLEAFPGNVTVQQELANLYYYERRYEKAEPLLRRALAHRPREQEYIFQRLLTCLVQMQRFDDAAEMLGEKIQSIEDSDLPEKKKQGSIASLEEKYRQVLIGSDLLRERMAAVSAQIADHPTSAVLHSRLGDLHLYAGDTGLALSQHLQAAYLAGNADHLVEMGKKLASDSTRPQAESYFQAVMEHFPIHPRIFEVVEGLLRIRERRDKRFAFSPQRLRALQMARETCRRILQDPDAPPDLRLEARMRDMRYRCEPLPAEPELWRKARAEAVELLEKTDKNTKMRRMLLDWLVEIDTKRLDNPRSAYETLQTMAREKPSPDTLKRLAQAASRLRPMPEPTLLRRYVQKQTKEMESDPKKRKDYSRQSSLAELEAALAVWLWDMGRSQEALSLLRSRARETQGRKKDYRASRFLSYLKRQRPELARLLSPDKPDPKMAGVVNLVSETVWEYNQPEVTAGVLGIHHEETRLELPRDLFPRKTVTLLTSERPSVVHPAVFVRPGGAASGKPGSADAAAQEGWTALWRPDPHYRPEKRDYRSVKRVGADVFSLSSPHEERPNDEVVMRRSFTDEGEEADTYLFQAYVRCPKPASLTIRFSSRLGTPTDVSPATGKVDKDSRTVRFDKLEDGGTTITIRLPRVRYKTTYRVPNMYPPGAELEMLVHEGVTETALVRTGKGFWSISPSGQDIRFEIRCPDDTKDNIPARLTSRTVYRLKKGGRY